LLEEAGFLPLDEIFVRTGVSPETAKDLPLLSLPGFAVSHNAFDRIAGQAVAHVRSYQSSHSLDPGLPLTTLRTALRLDHRFVDELVDELARRKVVVADGAVVRTPDFKPMILAPERDQILQELTEAGASPPTFAALAEGYGADMVRALVRSGDLVQVSPDFVYPAGWVEQVKGSLRTLIAETGPFTVAEFRDLIGTTRKFAVPLLEYLDRTGFTTRQGDVRKLGPKT
ncbi:MAG: SelB C-terminal domain-containing protein, partial [Actinomycetota bacterium]